MYLYRAVDSAGSTLDFLLNETRNTRAAKRFFRKILGNSHVRQPRVINVDKNPAYIGAVQDLKQDGHLSAECERRPTKYLNNIVEQDHRCVKRQFRAAMGYGTYPTAWRTIRGIEADHMIRKGQIVGVGKSDIISHKQFIHGLFGLAQ